MDIKRDAMAEMNGSDIVDRLSDLSGDVGRWGGKTIGDAIAEIDRLRAAIRRLAEQDATLSVCNGSVTVEIDATLTGAEREAIDKAAHAAAQLYPGPDGVALAVTLRGLLDRLGHQEGTGQQTGHNPLPKNISAEGS